MHLESFVPGLHGDHAGPRSERVLGVVHHGAVVIGHSVGGEDDTRQLVELQMGG